MATAGSRWGIVMSRNAGFTDQVCICLFHVLVKLMCIAFLKSYIIQVVELDFLYPSEGIHRRWDTGYRITAIAATTDQAAFVLSVPKKKLTDETQETLRTSAFPSTHVKVCNNL